MAHNLILSHGMAAYTYKTKYQKMQGGVIGLTANTDGAFPYDISKPEDVSAANRQTAFAFGWYYDPIVFGKYPDEMTALVSGGRLPSFTPEESEMVKGSFDFVGVNHYSSSYIKDNMAVVGTDWGSDMRTTSTRVSIDGKVIGPQAESPWLFVYPPGIRNVIEWIDKRYDHPVIYVFENGVSVPKENSMPITQAIHD